MICPNCNHEAPPRAYFCAYCGQLLSEPPSLPTAGQARLLLEIGGGYATETILTKSETIIGRVSDCDVSIDDSYLSRQHAQIVKLEDHYLIDDLHSANGTFVNQIAVLEPVVLHDGDRISVGRANLVFRREGDLRPAPKPQQTSTDAADVEVAPAEVGEVPPPTYHPAVPQALVPPPVIRPAEDAAAGEAFSIEAKGLLRIFGTVTAVNRLDLQVHSGEIFGLIGPDGAGKTTTIRMLTGLIGIQAGAVKVQGIDVRQYPDRVKEKIGYMAQRFNLYGDLTVGENIAFFADFYGVSRSDRVKRTKQLLEFMQLAQYTGRRAERLSGGMKQKLALACTLIHEPEVIFLDEPTTGVDPVSRREFWRILYNLLDRGVTIFVSTPYMDEAERCHRVGIMSKGKLIACDEPEKLKTLIDGELLEIAAQPKQQAQAILKSAPEVKSAVVFGGMLHVLVNNAQQDANRIATRLANQNVEVTTMRKIKPSVEDVFIMLSATADQKPAPAAGPY